MDFWIESPLNKAHFYDRKANAHVKRFLFDEAIECHSLACEELEKALKFTSNNKAKESIELQFNYHQKQKDFLRLKKLQYNSYKEALRVQKEAMSRILKARGTRENESEDGNEGVTLKKAIFRAIEEVASLLELLSHRDEDGVNNCKQNSSNEKELVNMASENKRSKDDTTVIEELKIVNYQLRSLVNELMAQLEASEKEVVILRQRISDLEAEHHQLKPESTNASAYSSPFVFSPSDELPRAVTSELPTLAPLELPDFDLKVLQSKTFDSKDT